MTVPSQAGGPRSGTKVQGGKLSPTEVPTPRGSLQPEKGGSGAALPIETVPHRE